MDAVIEGARAPDEKLDENFHFEEIKPLDGMTWEQIGELSSQIVFAVPHRAAEGVGGGIADHFGNWGRWGMPVVRFKDPHGGFIETVRSGIVRTFLEYARVTPHIRYLVMCDNDQQVDRFAPVMLARHDKPVVSGVVCGFTDEKGIFACFTVRGKDGGSYFPLASRRIPEPDGSFSRRPNAMPARGLVKAWQVGTGLICIRRDVLETMDRAGELPFLIPEPIRREAARTGDLRKSEDICFSDTCEMYGFDRYVDLAVHAVHYKNVGISWQTAGLVDSNLAVEDWDVTTGHFAVPEARNA